MAKRELSSTLKNLKFMQRAARREEKTAKKEEEIVLDTNFSSSAPPKDEASETCTGRQSEVHRDSDLVPEVSTSNNGELKRKQADGDLGMHPNKLAKNVHDNSNSSPSSSQSSQKQSNRGKLDWGLLKPPKSQHKKK
ncbi:hypothetical protein Leryth_011325 [Lithospermum erythrorhizon]|nr:hypothetical protein Leryth_011325 [Lithospermum erythrorhizon]